MQLIRLRNDICRYFFLQRKDSFARRAASSSQVFEDINHSGGLALRKRIVQQFSQLDSVLRKGFNTFV